MTATRPRTISRHHMHTSGVTPVQAQSGTRCAKPHSPGDSADIAASGDNLVKSLR